MEEMVWPMILVARQIYGEYTIGTYSGSYMEALTTSCKISPSFNFELATPSSKATSQTRVPTARATCRNWATPGKRVPSLSWEGVAKLAMVLAVSRNMFGVTLVARDTVIPKPRPGKE